MQRIAQVKTYLGTDTGTYYYHTDHLQSSTIITDQNGVNVEDMFYYPYGELKYNTGSVNVKHKFSGHEYDGESGLYYMGARYYDPRLARFISADTIVPLPFYPQSLNRYSFTLNNPVVLRELNGHDSTAPAQFTGPSGRTTGPTGQSGMSGGSGGAVSAGQANAVNIGYISVNNGRVTLNITNPQVGPSYGGVSPSAVVTPTLSIPSVPSIPSTPPNLNFGAIGGASQHGSHAGNIGGGSSTSNMTAHNGSGINNMPNMGQRVDVIEVTLASISGGSALVVLGAPYPGVKLVAGGVGTISTLLSVGYSYYQFSEGQISRNEFAVQIALDVTPMFGKAIAGRTGEVAFDVLEHQIGLGQALKSIFYDPNRKD